MSPEENQDTTSWLREILRTAGPVSPATAGAIVNAAEYAYRQHSRQRGHAWAQYEARQSAKAVLAVDATQNDPAVVAAYQIFRAAEDHSGRLRAACLGADGVHEPWAAHGFAAERADDEKNKAYDKFTEAWDWAISLHARCIGEAWRKSDADFMAAHRVELRSREHQAFDEIVAGLSAALRSEAQARHPFDTPWPPRRRPGDSASRPGAGSSDDRQPGWVHGASSDDGQSYARYLPGKGLLHVESRPGGSYGWRLEGVAWQDGAPWRAWAGEAGFPTAREAMLAADAHARAMPAGLFECLSLNELTELGRHMDQAWALLAEVDPVEDGKAGSLAFEIAGLRREVTDQGRIRLMPRPWPRWSSQQRKASLGARHGADRAPRRRSRQVLRAPRNTPYRTRLPRPATFWDRTIADSPKTQQPLGPPASQPPEEAEHD